MRIGHGFDAHRFASSGRLVLGGIEIPHTRGLAAHSDGDVLIHALCDALLGAAAAGDIGRHFPDDEAQFAGIDSRILLRRVIRHLQELELIAVNVDVTVIAQAPKLMPYIAAMRECLAEDMGLTAGQVNIKATTTEGMGYIGREEGIAVHAVALLKPIGD